MYGIIVFLYSAFCSALPIMYLIPITNRTMIEITIPTTWIIFTMFAPNVVMLLVSETVLPFSTWLIVPSMSTTANATLATLITNITANNTVDIILTDFFIFYSFLAFTPSNKFLF